jgi:hypothetical protein
MKGVRRGQSGLGGRVIREKSNGLKIMRDYLTAVILLRAISCVSNALWLKVFLSRP